MRLIYLVIAWLLGIVVAERLGLPLWVWGVGAIAAIAIIWIIYRFERDELLRFLGIGLVAFALGGGRQALAVPHFGSHDVAFYNDQGKTTIEGLIVRPPEVRDTYVNLRVRAEQVEVGGQLHQVDGLVLVQTRRFSGEYRYGDRVRASGRLQTPPVFEDFSYRDYLARKGVHSLMRRAQAERLATGQGNPVWAMLYGFTGKAQQLIGRLLPEPEAALLTGILLGVETGIPRDLYDRFNATGTSHIIVISGFNITIIAGLLAASAGRLFGRRQAVYVILAGIGLYVILVGADAAVVRAGIMGALAVIAIHLGRQSDAATSLFASAWLMTALNPFTLWDLGFQLSFAATLGLILFTPPLEAAFERGLSRLLSTDKARRLIALLNDVLIVTLAANITTMPLVVYYFHRFSLISLLTNFFILPAQPYVMTWGLAALATAFIFFPLGQVLAYVPYLCLAYTVWIVERMAVLPFASVEVGRFAVGWLLFYYMLLGLVILWWLARRDRLSPAWRSLWQNLTTQITTKATATVMGVCVVLIWLAAFQMPDGRLHLYFLDVGQGDAILIETPSGHQILVDGGPSPTALVNDLSEVMPFWDHHIDLVIPTHADGDHMDGLIPLFDRYQVGQVLEGEQMLVAPEAAPWREAVVAAGVPVSLTWRGMHILTGDNVELSVLNPPFEPLLGTRSDDNNNSIVLKVDYGRFSALLTADAEMDAERDMMAAGLLLQAQVLKVGHHGSRYSTGATFLKAVAPQVAVISVGADNRFGHPHPDLLDRLSGMMILRTDQHGTIELTSDGTRLWVRTER
ncbi:MAG TPA: DNA internalization-related competence protein ComEC/Rec2 [Anaerolineae bacterium]|nr:DNA internalization-related competence protein ComEC/Rec2 [Anaerolineae bacterium]